MPLCPFLAAASRYAFRAIDQSMIVKISAQCRVVEKFSDANRKRFGAPPKKCGNEFVEDSTKYAHDRVHQNQANHDVNHSIRTHGFLRGECFAPSLFRRSVRNRSS